MLSLQTPPISSTEAPLLHLIFSRAYPSQFRRAVVLCSTISSRDAHFDRIYDKLVDNGYSKEELLEARERALTLDRSDILDKNK